MRQNTKIRNTQMEVLAPAGCYETLRAVIEAGADAVYLGGPAFGARAYAGNFTKEELLDALDYAHLRGVKIYLTVNTLLKNSEIGQIREYLLPFYERGLDAVLVQDFGVLQLIHACFPDLAIHTSTQMTVTGPEGVRFLQQYGVKRVVMAREVSLAEMKRIHEATGIELEAFVHGAICYCYSGQCLFSSVLGGRSGNRGRCAQPCRLPYTVTDAKGKKLASDSYVLSLKDMCGIEDLQELMDSGVFSLKIEGRMKSADYASGVVSVYRKYVDELISRSAAKNVSREDREHLADLGSRCGFTDTYYHAHNGADMITFEKPNFASRNPAYHEQITKEYVEHQSQIPVEGYILMQKGMPGMLSVTCGDYSAAAEGMAPMEAQKKPMSREDLTERIRKTGGTDFTFSTLEVDMDEGIFLPNGAINQLRRDALDALKAAMLEQYYRTAAEVTGPEETGYPKGTLQAPELICEVNTEEQLKVALASSVCDAVYADCHLYFAKRSLSGDIAEAHADGKVLYLVLPRILRAQAADRLRSFFRQPEFQKPDGFVACNYEELQLIKELFPDTVIVTDHNMYAWNDLAAEAFRRAGVSRVSVPLELNSKEIAARENAFSEMMIYGYYPLMTTAGCVHKNTAGCDHREQITTLTDRYKTQFPVRNVCSECYNVIYNSVPTCLFVQVPYLRQDGIRSFKLVFTVEDASKMKEVLSLAKKAVRGTLTRDQLAPLGPVTNGHFKRGVE